MNRNPEKLAASLAELVDVEVALRRELAAAQTVDALAEGARFRIVCDPTDLARLFAVVLVPPHSEDTPGREREVALSSFAVSSIRDIIGDEALRQLAAARTELEQAVERGVLEELARVVRPAGGEP